MGSLRTYQLGRLSSKSLKVAYRADVVAPIINKYRPARMDFAYPSAASESRRACAALETSGAVRITADGVHQVPQR